MAPNAVGSFLGSTGKGGGGGGGGGASVYEMTIKIRVRTMNNIWQFSFCWSQREYWNNLFLGFRKHTFLNICHLTN